MSSKIVVLQHELVDRVINALDDEGWHKLSQEVLDAIAAPVVERQPVDAILLSNCVPGWHSDYNDGLFATDDAVQKLYAAPPELAELQATIARLTAALNIRDRELDIAAEHADGLQVENERLKGGQGEPVAWEVSGNGVKPGLFYGKPSWAGEGSSYELAPLFYTSQPAPVSVVLPERIEPPSDYAYRKGWNTCLDKLKELSK